MAMGRKKAIDDTEFIGFMNQYYHETGQYPCNKRLQDEFHVTGMTVHNYWTRLSNDGYFDLDDMKSKMERRELPPMLYEDYTDKIITFISNYQKINKFAPSADEVAEHIGVSVPVIYKYYNRLEQKGLISRIPNTARSVRVL